MGQFFGDRRASRGLDAGRRLIVVAMVAILLAGCGASSSPPPGSSDGSPAANAPTNTMSSDDAIRTYGYGPSASPSVTFQPDVVVVGGGAASVRWASDDGHTWAIDPAAPGASKLKVGSVMMLTSRAVGRVVDLRDEAGNRVVTLGPVQLTEIFDDANFNFDQPLDLGSMAYQAFPETANDVTTPSDAPSADSGGNLNDNAASPSPGAIRLLERDLVDELNLRLVPVVVGDGFRLFPERGQTHDLTPVESRSMPSGVTILTYQPAGRVTFGTVGE